MPDARCILSDVTQYQIDCLPEFQSNVRRLDGY